MYNLVCGSFTILKKYLYNVICWQEFFNEPALVSEFVSIPSHVTSGSQGGDTLGTYRWKDVQDVQGCLGHLSLVFITVIIVWSLDKIAHDDSEHLEGKKTKKIINCWMHRHIRMCVHKLPLSMAVYGSYGRPSISSLWWISMNVIDFISILFNERLIAKMPNNKLE